MTSVLGENLQDFGSPDKRQLLIWDVCGSRVSRHRTDRHCRTRGNASALEPLDEIGQHRRLAAEEMRAS
jgi:hypothetical protein